jgi:hypothetical protein
MEMRDSHVIISIDEHNVLASFIVSGQIVFMSRSPFLVSFAKPYTKHAAKRATAVVTIVFIMKDALNIVVHLLGIYILFIMSSTILDISPAE